MNKKEIINLKEFSQIEKEIEEIIVDKEIKN